VTDSPRTQRARRLQDEQGKVVRRTLDAVPKGATEWRSRRMAQPSGVSQSSVFRTLARISARAPPNEDLHAEERFISADKLRDIVGPSISPLDMGQSSRAMGARAGEDESRFEYDFRGQDFRRGPRASAAFPARARVARFMAVEETLAACGRARKRSTAQKARYEPIRRRKICVVVLSDDYREQGERSSSFPSSPGRWNEGHSTGLVPAS
jgi:hypothetical protein